ncbi:hypothetical protein BRW62_08005 [Parathermosynechococcus lividus PCC 6715]|uniref:Uncharacterized protein n=1 Tax=Parathermosynechococcus lividus PCC 6715 TaxID=1917166 RepID=A0A2D2Q2E6_PARLV|nr:hypothetical protein BRW62_08005 [Thermostichus lividus PCC 6715]
MAQIFLEASTFDHTGLRNRFCTNPLKRRQFAFTENLREAPHLQVGEGQERQLRGVQYPRNCQV